MAASKLLIYNNALQILGERRLSNPTEDREPRYVLDQAYELDLVEHCLEVAKPRFSVNSAKLASPAASTVHGLDSVYSLPSDYISTLGEAGLHGSNGSFFSDEDFQNPVDRYIIENRTVATDVATNLWIRYISKSRPLSSWTPTFARLVSAYLARETASRLNPSRIEIAEAAYQSALAKCIELEGVKENDVIPQAPAASLSADQLTIYNQAAAALGRPEFRSVNNGSSLRLAMDSIYTIAVEASLEEVKPRFAVLSARLGTPATSSVHGLDSVYTLPSDYLSTLGDQGVHGANGSFFSDEDFQNPVDRYVIEARTVATDIPTNLWIRYISNDVAESVWTPSFREVVSLRIALLIAKRFSPEGEAGIAEMVTVATEKSIQREGIKENAPLPQAPAASLSAEQLQIYNSAAAMLAQPEFRHGDDGSALRLAMDSVYALAEDDLLETIKPKFATRVVSLTGGSPSAIHGYDNVFDLPADFKNICELWSDENLEVPITRYFLEDDKIAIDGYATAYIRYIIGTTAESAWSPLFKKAMSAYIANELAYRYVERLPAQNIAEALKERVGLAVQVDGAKEPSMRPISGTRTLDDTYRALYNKALQMLRLPQLVSNTDESERKVALDYALDNKAVETVFELISWGFLYKTAELAPDGAETPTVGFDYSYAVPADMIRIDKLSADEYFRYPVNYAREGGYFETDATTLYIRYLSNEQTTTPSTWPTYIYNLVAAELARACAHLPNADMKNAEFKYQEYKGEAFSTDAQRNPPQVIAEGSWTRARSTWPTRRYQRP